ncbi:MAG: hypothetical protein ISEC1_P0306 [Thiomicrorhabdus sp.]|nr:MAG: hypothetical protein ISEC1_P0306 [Thiomicrorhabdus sp.]
MQNDLRVYAKGEAFQNSVYDLRSLELLLSNYRSILDSLVSVQLGYQKTPAAIKKQLNYDVQIKEGSIELLLDFALQNKQIIGALAADGGYVLSNTLVNLYRDSIALRTKASEFIEKALPFTININITDSFNIAGRDNVSTNIDRSEIIISDPKILMAAQATKTATDKLIHKIDGTTIEYIDLNSNDSEFQLNEDNKNILGSQKEILSASIQIIGRLDMIAFSSHKGSIISNNESFSVTWDEKIRSKMQKIADIDGVIFTVQPVIDHKRLNTDAIGFHILNCEEPQQKIDFISD